ncbi:hypothetical protein GCM10020331_010280 [Ectobacillus funiculus]
MSILKKFVKHKIPVLLVDTDISLEHKTSYIGTDNFELGKKSRGITSFAATAWR